MTKPYTQSEFIEKLHAVNPNILILGQYTSAHSRIPVQCKTCGKQWSPQAYQLIQGHGCPECGKLLAIENKKGKTAKKTTEQFVFELESVNKNIAITGEYSGTKNKIDCLCKVCGNKWKGTPYALLHGTGCPVCSKTQRMNYRRYTPESFEEKVHQVNPDVELLSPFTKSTEIIEAKCKKCGYKWISKAYKLLQSKGCPKCSHILGAKNNQGKTGLKSREKFVEQLSQVDASIKLIGEYTNTHTNAQFKCDRCNHIWIAKPYALLQGHGCPRCAKSGTSFMEQLILACFREVLGDGEVLSRDKSLIGMELDIFIPKYNLAIEPGNWFLHQRSIKRDEQKRIRCKDKNVRLITIYDKFPEDSVPPFSDYCYVYSDDLNIVDHSIIHNLIYDLFSECGIDKHFSNSEWTRLEEAAYDNSKALTHDEFVKKLASVRSDIEVIGRYENANRRIEVKCKNCGYTWLGVPANMLSGDGCKKCGARRRGDKARKTQEDFEKELSELIPTVKVIGKYISRHKPILVKCMKCGKTWTTTPGSLLRKEHKNTTLNNGCPVCAKIYQGTPKKKVLNIDTGEVFDSASSAGIKYEIVPSAIRQCCRGISNSAKGYHWKYLEE